jgi:hypothetical protein
VNNFIYLDYLNKIVDFKKFIMVRVIKNNNDPNSNFSNSNRRKGIIINNLENNLQIEDNGELLVSSDDKLSTSSD